jgi:hypothetical protein
LANRRSGRLAALLFAWIPLAAGATCPLLPGEKNLDFRVVDERTVELRRRGEPQGLPPLCVLRLGCKVEGEVRAVAYRLREGSILLGDISALHFFYVEGGAQACPVSEIRVPR